MQENKKIIAAAAILLFIAIVIIVICQSLKNNENVVLYKEAGADMAREIITFGRYEQDGDTSNGAEPIEWIVLDKQEDSMLIISRYGLDCQNYNTENTHRISWETCTLRDWLNNEFYNAAFNDAEKTAIKKTIISSRKNLKSEENSISDNVFCLSMDEADTYFKTEEARAAKPTLYAAAQGVHANELGMSRFYGNCWWWLRSPDGKWNDAAGVSYYGSVVIFDHAPYYNYLAVRPALWIEI